MLDLYDWRLEHVSCPCFEQIGECCGCMERGIEATEADPFGDRYHPDKAV